MTAAGKVGAAMPRCPRAAPRVPWVSGGAAELLGKPSPRRALRSWTWASAGVQVGPYVPVPACPRGTTVPAWWRWWGLVASLHGDGALRSGWGRADNSCEDKDTRDCCLINSGEEEYQALVLIHPLAKDIVFLSLL